MSRTFQLELQRQLGALVRLRRKEHNYTQREIATWIQTSRTNYNKKESGRIPFTATEFWYILLKMKVTGKKPLPIAEILQNFISSTLKSL